MLACALVLILLLSNQFKSWQKIVVLIALILCICIILAKPSSKSIIYSTNRDSDQVKNLMVVAHPDDETLWGYSYLSQHPDQWKVICLTCADHPIRREEFIKVMNMLNIHNYQIWSEKDSLLNWDLSQSTKQRLKNELLTGQYELVVTHNLFGEYGHLQHIALSRYLKNLCQQHQIKLKFFNFGHKYQTNQTQNNILANYGSQKYIVNILKRCLAPFYG